MLQSLCHADRWGVELRVCAWRTVSAADECQSAKPECLELPRCAGCLGRFCAGRNSSTTTGSAWEKKSLNEDRNTAAQVQTVQTDVVLQLASTACAAADSSSSEWWSRSDDGWWSRKQDGWKSRTQDGWWSRSQDGRSELEPTWSRWSRSLRPPVIPDGDNRFAAQKWNRIAPRVFVCDCCGHYRYD